MKMVTFGKIWEIKNMDDLTNAWNELKEADFIASMSDDWFRGMEEQAEVKRQMRAVAQQAQALGLL